MLRSTDRILLLILPLFVFFLFVGFKSDRLIHHFFLNNPKKQNAIGLFQKVEGDVRKRQDRSFIWIAKRQGDLLNKKDTIFVGDQAQAQILLKKDIHIEIQENSLLTIYDDGSDDDPLLSLTNGTIKASSIAGKKINIKNRYSENQTITLSEKEVEIKSKASVLPSTSTPILDKRLSLGKTKLNTTPEDVKNKTDNYQYDKDLQNFYIGMAGFYLLIILGLAIDIRFSKKKGEPFKIF